MFAFRAKNGVFYRIFKVVANGLIAPKSGADRL